MAASISIAAIVEGRVEEWRAFIAELRGIRRIEWAQSQRNRGITREVICLAGADPHLVVVYSESKDPDAADALLAESDDAFDEWYRSRLGELLDGVIPSEVVFDSAPRPGPWRGWR